MSTQRIHIGDALRKRAEQLNKGPTELGREIHCTRNNIYRYYESTEMRTDTLRLFCRALDFNFFKLIADDIEGITESAAEPLELYKKQEKEKEKTSDKVGVTFFIDVSDIDNFKTEFKDFLADNRE
jgi:hypothetical protein